MLAGVGAVGRVGRHGISGGAKRPSFSVDFVNGGGSLGPGAVFTRASTGTYYDSAGVLRSAAINTPRFDYDPATLQLKGLLLEDVSTNLCLQSANLANAPWGVAGVTATPPVVTGNQIVAPDGTTTGTKLDYPAVSGAGSVSYIRQAIVVTAAAYTFSIWLRGSVGGEQTYINATDGTTQVNSTRLVLTTAWTRYIVTGTLSAVSWTFSIGTDLRGVTTATSTPAQTIYAWGAQVEALPYMGSHIPTTTVAVTRAVDSLRYPVASVIGFDAAKGSLSHEYIVEGCVPNFNAPIQFVGANTNADFISVDQTTTFGATGSTPVVTGALVKVAGVNQGNAILGGGSGIPIPGGVVHRCAAAWALSGNTICAHDGAGQTSTAGVNASLPVVTNLTIAGLANSQPNVVSQWARRTRYWPRQLSQAELISATVLDGPTLSLDFMSDGTLDPRITFTRASTATYTDANGVVRTAATNAPRWDYAGGVLRGLLIEETRTNIALQSADLSNAAWSSAGVTVSAPVVTGNNIAAPDGTTTASRVVYPAVPTGSNVSSITQTRAATASVYSFSMWLKGSVGGEVIYLYTTPDSVTYYRQQCVLTTQWQRFTLTTGTLTAMGWFFGVGNDGRAGGPSTLAQTIYAWGAQVEQGAFATSYIPTTSVSVTRAIENVSMPIGPWFSTAASTLYAEFQFPRLTTTGVSAHDVVSLEGNQNALTIRAMEGPSSNASFRTYNFGVAGRADLTGTMTTAPAKIAAAWSATRGAGSYRGNAVGSYVAGLPINMNALIIGNASVNNNSVLGGWVRRVLYWNRALSDTELQQVTT